MNNPFDYSKRRRGVMSGPGCGGIIVMVIGRGIC